MALAWKASLPAKVSRVRISHPPPKSMEPVETINFATNPWHYALLENLTDWPFLGFVFLLIFILVFKGKIKSIIELGKDKILFDKNEIKIVGNFSQDDRDRTQSDIFHKKNYDGN